MATMLRLQLGMATWAAVLAVASVVAANQQVDPEIEAHLGQALKEWKAADLPVAGRGLVSAAEQKNAPSAEYPPEAQLIARYNSAASS